MAEATEAMDIEPVTSGSSPADDDPPPLLYVSPDIPAGQRPRDSQDMRGSPPALSADAEPPGDIQTITLVAMEKVRQKKLEDQKQRSSTNKN